MWLLIEYSDAVVMRVTESDNLMSIANRYKPIAMTVFKTKKEATRRLEAIRR